MSLDRFDDHDDSVSLDVEYRDYCTAQAGVDTAQAVGAPVYVGETRVSDADDEDRQR